MTKTYSIRYRVGITVGEILIGIAILVIALLIIPYLLVFTKQLNIHGTSFDIVLGDKVSTEEITKQMDTLTFDYVLFNRKNGEVLNGNYQKTELSYYETVFEDKKPINVGTIDYKAYSNDRIVLVVRQPTLPEFVNPSLRKVSFNTLSIILFIVGTLSIVFISVTKLLREFAHDFRLIQKISLNMGSRDYKIERLTTKINEFNDILAMLYQKDDELTTLLEAERAEKKDLSFQVAALSHDVRTPLTVLKGNLELLEMTDLSNQQISFIGSINHSVSVFEKYFNSMITYSRLLIEERDYQEVIEVTEFMSGLQIEIQEIMHTEQVDFDMKNNLRITHFKGNRLNLERALINILVNAAQHAADVKQVSLTVKEEQDQLIFEIWNSGSRFSQQALNDANKLFFTEDNGRSSKHYGIGLSFAQGVAVRHQGKLQLLNPLKGAQVNLIIRKYELLL